MRMAHDLVAYASADRRDRGRSFHGGPKKHGEYLPERFGTPTPFTP